MNVTTKYGSISIIDSWLKQYSRWDIAIKVQMEMHMQYHSSIQCNLIRNDKKKFMDIYHSWFVLIQYNDIMCEFKFSI